jgi:hypothetical protein
MGYVNKSTYCTLLPLFTFATLYASIDTMEISAPSWLRESRFLTLNEKKKLYLGGPDAVFAADKT